MQAILFAATKDPTSSREFYEHKLGLQFIENSPFALVFEINGITLRVQKVEQVLAPPYTLIGFAVDHLEATVERLQNTGVIFEHYDFLQQSSSGIWTTPEGARIAWCKDPDGNVVSFSQSPTAG